MQLENMTIAELQFLTWELRLAESEAKVKFVNATKALLAAERVLVEKTWAIGRTLERPSDTKRP